MDWDGTTSLVRAGWADIMTDVYLESLPLRPGEEPATLRRFAWDELMRLNGRPSIHQMGRLAELILEREGQPRSAAEYQADFQRRLSERVAARLEAARRDRQQADALLVPGVRDFFEHARGRGLPLTLASGTPLPHVREEAEMLGVAAYFEERIFGPVDTHDTTFTKREVIARLLKTHSLEGATLLAFGDGPAEIAETAAVGGFAVAVAGDETHPGRLDEWKRDMLLAAGASAVITDYREVPALLEQWGVL
jgi:phosphoglycolate phosphatase-like HAD superfamily hydrolase